MNKATQLKRFLVENNCKREYLDNINSNGGKKWLLAVLEEDIEIAISCAFNWKSSPQGFDYWAKIDDKLTEKYGY